MGGWEKRLEELSQLEDGWYDGKGRSISVDAIENAKNIMECLQNYYKQDNLPTIFPTPYGWVQLQCSDDERGLYGEVLIGPQGQYEGYLLLCLTLQEQHHDFTGWGEAASFIHRWFGDGGER